MKVFAGMSFIEATFSGVSATRVWNPAVIRAFSFSCAGVVVKQPAAVRARPDASRTNVFS